jgi:hypothetical protein
MIRGISFSAGLEDRCEVVAKFDFSDKESKEKVYMVRVAWFGGEHTFKLNREQYDRAPESGPVVARGALRFKKGQLAGLELHSIEPAGASAADPFARPASVRPAVAGKAA